ncbi:hypothetical protein EVAR_31746_1 [Eumeta japonica]|uniref:Uncharacterized protein n=1 Tax=Eumeta variegata TaxID=151549 RepID=A0A4C1W5P0_EUMVA|nr:hypothetical protein EVAR_31746_1 [Eumeta japonica]
MGPSAGKFRAPRQGVAGAMSLVVQAGENLILVSFIQIQTVTGNKIDIANGSEGPESDVILAGSQNENGTKVVIDL